MIRSGCMFLAIVPAYNEAPRIGSVIRSLFAHVDRVLVVDDGSTDETARVAGELGAHVIIHRVNRGQGAALETGHAYARLIGAEYVLHFDADGQFDAADVSGALQQLREQNADILLGSRFMDVRSRVPWTKRHLILPIGRLIHRFVFGVHLSDAHNGFRILNKQAIELLHITQDRMAHATEIPARAQRLRLRIIEHPVRVTYHTYGQGIKGGMNVVKDLLFSRFVK